MQLKIKYLSNLVKKTYYDAKISNIESKFITTADYNKFTKDIVDNNIKIKNVVDKPDIAGFINNTSLDEKKTSNISNKSWIKSRIR